ALVRERSWRRVSSELFALDPGCRGAFFIVKIDNFRGTALALTFLLMATASYGQTPAQGAAPAAGPPPADAQAQAPAPFPKEKLDQMLAPIALYPDQLVTNIL